MAIKYEKLFALLKANGINTTKIRRDKIMGQGTLTAIKKGTGGLDAKTLNKLCTLLNCQPGDIMEYIPDDNTMTETGGTLHSQNQNEHPEGV